MTAQEKLAEVQAELELERLGFIKGDCESCKGSGFTPIPSALSGCISGIPCGKCEGVGVDWVKKP